MLHVIIEPWLFTPRARVDHQEPDVILHRGLQHGDLGVSHLP